MTVSSFRVTKALSPPRGPVTGRVALSHLLLSLASVFSPRSEDNAANMLNVAKLSQDERLHGAGQEMIGGDGHSLHLRWLSGTAPAHLYLQIVSIHRGPATGTEGPRTSPP